MFFEQLKLICAMRGTTPTSVIRKIGLSSGNVTSWKNGSSPKKDILEKLAKELDVPVSAFFDSVVEKQTQLQAEELELLEVYRKLCKSCKRQLMGKAYELLDSQNNPQSAAEAAPPNLDMAAPIVDRRIKK